MEIDSHKIIFFAPNVHTGGGLILLMDVIKSCHLIDTTIFFLDVRAKHHLKDFVTGLNVFWCNSGFKGRFDAELELKKIVKITDFVLCFHNMPPLFARSSFIKVFMQNRLLIDDTDLANYRLWTRIRTSLEVLLCKRLSSVVQEYIVQTETMSLILKKWLESFNKSQSQLISVLPFAREMHVPKQAETDVVKIYDFIYIADGEAHKNHLNLLDAWVHLAKKGIYPSLVLTLSARDMQLKSLVDLLKQKYSLRIFDLGVIEHDDINALYSSAKALVFPSKLESFGLPLIEARNLNVPIIASELDFVRDVCTPIETFNPNSSLSISRAILRFLGQADSVIEILSPESFWHHLES